MTSRIDPSSAEEQALAARGITRVAGLDEVAAAVGPDRSWPPPSSILRPASIGAGARFQSPVAAPAGSGGRRHQSQGRGLAVGQASAAEVDVLNIRRAAALAMSRALDGLAVKPEIPADRRLPPARRRTAAKNIIRGDASVVSIAAASIVAKVARDALLRDLAGGILDTGSRTTRVTGRASTRRRCAALDHAPNTADLRAGEKLTAPAA